MQWSVVLSSFTASVVECVEAFTVVLAVGVTINWRSAFTGAALALVVLALLIAIFGATLITVVPLSTLRLIIGGLLILFGLKWLKKAILRYAGIKALHDEEAIYEHEMALMRAQGIAGSNKVDRFGVILAMKTVLLEGLEVVFIVITFGISSAQTEAAKVSGLQAAALGAVAAVLLVLVVGALVHAPLRRVPENMLKFGVGIMLVSFGTFWAGEGVGVQWIGDEIALAGLIVAYMALSIALVLWLRKRTPAALPLPATL